MIKDNKVYYYNACLDKATESTCIKAGFGCMLVLENKPIIVTCNGHSDWAKTFCEEGKCIRFKIPSRTNSLIGACGHAEEKAIWSSVKKYGTAKGANLYVTGVQKPSNEPLIYNRTEFSCIRCATVMCYAEVERIYWWTNGTDLVSQTPYDAYVSSMKFAIGEYKV